jgi:NAD(P)-dependent dehydrogenase (short-subunit alcohol dehydrogenase family)
MTPEGWVDAHTPRLDGRVVLVTGANSGVGLHAARFLARRGATVILACRDPQKAEGARKLVAAEGGSASTIALDLSDLASVRACADEVATRHVRLDVLINNAGVMAIPRRLTKDGFEMQLGTNHLGHFALTGRLLPLLRASDRGTALNAGEPRVVTISSVVHRRGRMDFDDLQGEKAYDKRAIYAQSKLANLLFARELGKREPWLLSVAAHPGYSATNLQLVGPQMSGSAFGAWVWTGLNALLGQSAEMGALPTVLAATAPAKSGDYFGPQGFREYRGWPGPGKLEPHALDDAAAARLWDLSVAATGVAF